MLQLPFGCFEPSVSEGIGAPPPDGEGAQIKAKRRRRSRASGEAI